MKIRADLIQKCCYPPLPKRSFSLHHLYHSGKADLESLDFIPPFLHSFFCPDKKLAREDPLWLGGCLKTHIAVDSFFLNTQFYKVKCFVSEDCSLFFDFQEHSKGLVWKEVFSLLKEGDHLLMRISDPARQIRKNMEEPNAEAEPKAGAGAEVEAGAEAEAEVEAGAGAGAEVEAGAEAEAEAGAEDMMCLSRDRLSSDKKKQEIHADPVWEIKNINKLVLVSVNKKTALPLFADPTVVQKQKNWFVFLDKVHEGMRRMGLERVDTPSLVDCPGTEPDVGLFETRIYSGFSTKSSSEEQEERMKREKQNPEIQSAKNVSATKLSALSKLENIQNRRLFLSTSPEMSMKKLLCRGGTDIYEIKKCFRNNESGPMNHIEFYLLEWYRAYSGLNILIEDLRCLLNFLSKQITGSRFPDLQLVSMKELFRLNLNMELSPCSSGTCFARELHKRNIPFEDSQDVEDLFYLLFLNEIEPNLDFETPFIIYDYPPFQKAYARIGPEGWASRFELFWRGMELANAFDEVIQAEEQEYRFKEHQLKRQRQGLQEAPSDYELLENMQAGMPPSAGVAVGLDRLFLAFKGLSDIRHIRLFN